MSESRIKLLTISDKMFLSWVNGGNDPTFNVGQVIPSDARIVNARMGVWPGTVVYTVWSASFAEVQEGMPIPELKPEYRRL